MQCTADRFAIQPLLFNHEELSRCFFIEPTIEEEAFMEMWGNLSELMPPEIRYDDGRSSTGRPGYPLLNILAVHAVKLFFSLKTITGALEKLRSNINLRMIVGMSKIPSAATVCEKTAQLCLLADFSRIQEEVCSSFYKERLVCHLSIDSTIVEAREKPAVHEKPEKRKRGRKKKDSGEPSLKEEKDKRLEAMKSGDVDEFLSTLEHRCSVTGKKNSKGHMQWFVGYKAHLAVDDDGIIVASHVTGASVHDSQVAIPLIRMAAARCDFLYALMDGGYTSREIEDFVSSLGKVPIIDSHADPKGNKKQMDPATALRYRARTTVERTNSEMKECFLPSKLYSRGKRALFQIDLAILMTNIKKITLRLRREAEAGLTA